MVEFEKQSRLDVRKALIGGLLAWAVQALAMFVHRLP